MSLPLGYDPHYHVFHYGVDCLRDPERPPGPRAWKAPTTLPCPKCHAAGVLSVAVYEDRTPVRAGAQEEMSKVGADGIVPKIFHAWLLPVMVVACAATGCGYRAKVLDQNLARPLA